MGFIHLDLSWPGANFGHSYPLFGIETVTVWLDTIAWRIPSWVTLLLIISRYATPIWAKSNEWKFIFPADWWWSSRLWLGINRWVTELSHELEMEVRKEQVIRTVGSVWRTRHMGTCVLFCQFIVWSLVACNGFRDGICSVVLLFILNTAANTILPLFGFFSLLVQDDGWAYHAPGYSTLSLTQLFIFLLHCSWNLVIYLCFSLI